MLGTPKQSIEDLIVEALAKKPYIAGPELVASIQKERPNTTKQAVYIALKTLLASETVAKAGGEYFLTRVWLGKIQRLLGLKNETQNVPDAIFDLQDGESISYRFPSLLSCDTYWAHIFNTLVEWTPKERPICIWNPHEWFAVGRTEVEKEIFNEYERHDKYIFHTIGGRTALDRAFLKEWGSKRVQINMDENFLPQNYYLNVFGDFIVEVFFDDAIVGKIEAFYQKYETLTPENTKEFEKLLEEKYPVRMKISHKKKKAAELRKQLSKEFYVPEHLNL